MKDGSFPDDAFVAGSQKNVNQIFVARVPDENRVTPCQLHQGNAGAQYADGGTVQLKSSYEILAADNNLHWKKFTIGELPEEALQTGNKANGDAMYSVKYKFTGKTCIGKYNGKNKNKAFFVHEGNKFVIEKRVKMEILCYQGSAPEKYVSIGTKYFAFFLRFHGALLRLSTF